MTSLGAPELLIILVIGVFWMVPLALSIWALVDLVQYPDEV